VSVAVIKFNGNTFRCSKYFFVRTDGLKAAAILISVPRGYESV
jgi:hypothetical protein